MRLPLLIGSSASLLLLFVFLSKATAGPQDTRKLFRAQRVKVTNGKSSVTLTSKGESAYVGLYDSDSKQRGLIGLMSKDLAFCGVHAKPGRNGASLSIVGDDNGVSPSFRLMPSRTLTRAAFVIDNEDWVGISILDSAAIERFKVGNSVKGEPILLLLDGKNRNRLVASQDAEGKGKLQLIDEHLQLKWEAR